MNRIFFLLFLIVAGCSSKTPVDMEDVLYDRSGQYITDDNYDPSFLGFIYNQKVYNGPGYLRYRSGEKREQGTLKNGYKSGAWTGYDKKGNKKFIGEYEQGRAPSRSQRHQIYMRKTWKVKRK